MNLRYKKFLDSMRSKSFYRNLDKLLKGSNITDIDVAISVSSLLTHLLIEMRSNKGAYIDYQIQTISSILNSFLLGDITVLELREKLLSVFNGE